MRDLAAMYAEAFLDDPGWKDVGPASPRRRRAYIRRICGGELRAAKGVGGTVRASPERDAAIVWFPTTEVRQPWRLMVTQAPGAVLGGPSVLARSLRAESTMDAGHPAEPHLYVSLLAVHPSSQRGGRGRALLGAAIEEAERREIPAYLDTANPANLPYYRQFGFEISGEGRLPRGTPMWYLLRAR